jgi:thiol-disulfide isomerase/thioredoxin
VAGVVVLLAASFAFNRDSTTVGHPADHMAGTYAAVGSRGPAFTGRNVITGQTITSAELKGKKVLYYFSEGSGCQACMVQAQSLEQQSAKLRADGITLVSITNDSPSILRQAAACTPTPPTTPSSWSTSGASSASTRITPTCGSSPPTCSPRSARPASLSSGLRTSSRG